MKFWINSRREKVNMWGKLIIYTQNLVSNLVYQYWFIHCGKCIIVMQDVNREMGVKYIEAFCTFSIIQTSKN